ncbi:MAG: TolA-binding protein [Chitinophagales bacterium]|jgi:TolA-binding protein
MKNLLKVILGILFLIQINVLIGQETSYYAEKNKHLKEGLSLMDQKLYAPAQLEFELLNKELQEANDNDEYTLHMFADFYYAYCAAKLGQGNTELLFTRFIEAYHETTLRNKAYFELGSYYFRKNKTVNAVKWYEKVDTKQLSNDELIEYKFNFGYAYFRRKKFDEAKPLFKSIKDAKHSYSEPATYYYGFINFYEENYKEAEKSFIKLKDSKLYKDAVPYYLTQLYFLRKDYELVISYAGPLLRNPSTDNIKEIAHIVGQAYFELGDYESATPLIEAYIVDAKKVSKEELYQLAYAQYRTANYRDAVNNFQQLNVLEDSLGQNATYCLADCYLKTDDKVKARDAFSQAASLDFDPIIKETASFKYGKLSYELSYTNQAITSLSGFLNDYPNSAYTNEAGNLLSQALLETKNYAKAIEILETYNVSGPAVEKVYQMVCYYRGVELYNDKKYAESIIYVNKSINTPIDNDILGLSIFLKGNIQYELGNYANAASEFTKFKQFNIKDQNTGTYASKTLANYNLAYCNFKEKNYLSAASFFEQTIKNPGAINGTNQRIIPDAFLRNADCLFMTKSYNKAINNYDEVINQNWQGAEYALVQKSVINGLQGNYIEKVNTLEYLNSNYPNNIYKDYALYEMGNAFVNVGNFNSAIVKLKILTATYPSSLYAAKGFLKLGFAYFNTQQEEKALVAYKKVVLDYKSTEEAKEALRALKELYIFLGRPNDYLAFVQNQAGITISATEQDSLLFEAAENQYLSGNCTKALPSLSEYIQLFPTGNFIVSATYYRADCFFKSNNFDEAYLDYKKLIGFGASKYQENALLKATYIAYEIQNNYVEALYLYYELKNKASLQSNQEIALIGMLRCNFKLKNYEEVITNATAVLSNAAMTEEVKTEATFYKAKALLEKNKYQEAEAYFEQIVSTVSISAIKAESAYSLAYILHKKYLYESSNSACFKIKNDYASYEYWVVKTFILIADNYVMLDNIFQAKATLQSIVDNYNGDQALLQEAKDKLAKIKADEIENTKVDLNLNPSDTIQFDNFK